MRELIYLGLLAGVRSQALKILLFSGLFLIAAALLAASFSGRQPATVGLDIGLSGLRLILLVVCLLWVQLLLAQDIERKTLYFMLAYPYSRDSFLLSRFAALALLALLAVFLLGLALWLGLQFLGSGYQQLTPPALDGRYVMVLLGIWLDLLVVLAFALLMCSLSTTPFLPLLLGLAFAFAARGFGPTLDYLRSELMSGSGQSRWFGPVLEYAYLWLPDLSRLDWRPLALYGLPIDLAQIGLSTLMALAYIALLLSTAVMVFRRRNFI